MKKTKLQNEITIRIIILFLLVFFLKGLHGCNSAESEIPAKDWREFNDSLINNVEADSAIKLPKD